MKIDFHMSDDTATMTISGRENGVESYSCKVHGFEPATGLKRFYVPECEHDEPAIEKADDLAGFILVDPEELPLRTKFYALLTNCRDVNKAAQVMNTHNDKKTWTEFYHDCKQKLRLALPPLFRLGVVARSKRLPLWAQPIDIIEETTEEPRTIGYWPGYRRTEKLRWDYNVTGFWQTSVHYEIEEREGLARVYQYAVRLSDWPPIEKQIKRLHWKHYHDGVIVDDVALLYLTKPFPSVERVALNCTRVQAGQVAKGKKLPTNWVWDKEDRVAVYGN